MSGATCCPAWAPPDFACFLERKPGAYIWIGNGTADHGGALHSPHYDFNDAILPVGASYWVRPAESVLGKVRDSALNRASPGADLANKTFRLKRFLE